MAQNCEIIMARIGITVFVKADGSYGLFENGLKQNVIFLYQLLSNRHDVWLLNRGEGLPTESLDNYGIPGDRVVSSLDQPDVIISLGAGLSKADKDQYKDAKIVAYMGGNGGVISMEAVCSNPIRTDAVNYYDHDFYDLILMTPQHESTYKSWCETLYRCAVSVVPQVWGSSFIPEGYGFKATQKFRIACLDPNITVMKTSHYPIMVSELLYREEPALIQSLLVTNAIQFASHPHFAVFANRLSIFKDGIATVEARYKGTDFIRDHADAVVTHDWENGLNYLYLEALHGGYPLIHSSTLLPTGVGYQYPSFVLGLDAKLLCDQLKSHTGVVPAVEEYLDSVNVNNTALLNIYEIALGI